MDVLTASLRSACSLRSQYFVSNLRAAFAALFFSRSLYSK
ncbi:gluconate 5-dehydrogenase [Yersinia enterocolitica]|nr:gluconate 5-dehydrogenase [Yersinia enterocolitica]